MPVGGDWTAIKREATKFVKPDDGNAGTLPSPDNLLRLYFGARGDSGGGASAGGSRAGSGGSFGGTAQRTGQSLGGFLSSVQNVGLSETLRNIGLAHLINKSFSEISRALLNLFTSPGSSLDEHAVREALIVVNDAIVDGAEEFNDVEAALKENIDSTGITGIIQLFFGEYIYQLFCQDFYEIWCKKEGFDQAAKKLVEVKDYITQKLKTKLMKSDAVKVDWHGNEGKAIIQKIMQNTKTVFGLS